MSNLNEKINKYRNKLMCSKNEQKSNIYIKKINYYSGMVGGANDSDQQNLQLEIQSRDLYSDMDKGLRKPGPRKDFNYKLDIDNPIAIKAIGYGTLSEIKMEGGDNPQVPVEFERRAPRDDDLVIQILYCGVCHSDWHVALNEWNNTKYPIVVGHEITGKVLKIGKGVTKFREGQNIAVGPNYSSCRQCAMCKSNFENYCINQVTETYNFPDRFPGQIEATGPISQGGNSNIIVVNENYAVAVPDGMPLDKCAPLLCAGITMYQPLKYLGIKQGDRVGIAGCGGLGHLGIKLAKAMGTEVIVLTRTPWKLEDSLRLGADKSVLVTDLDTLNKFHDTFDCIIDTIPFKHDLDPYVKLLRPLGTLCITGAFYCLSPDFNIVNRKGRTIRGFSTGGIADTQELINLCAENNILPEINLININDINKTHNPIINSQVKYRYVIDMSTLK